MGTWSLVPDELIEGYGADAALPELYLMRPGVPLSGHVNRFAGYPTPGAATIHVGSPEFFLQQRRAMIWQAAYDAIMSGIGRDEGISRPNPLFLFKWRAQGSTDAWMDIPGQFLGVVLNSEPSLTTEGARVVRALVILDHRLDPTDPLYDAAAPDLPTEDQIIEFFLIGALPPDEHHPAIVEGISAGQFAANVYAGLYSRRDPVTGALVSTSIRYDEAALLLMTDLVRIRLTAPIEDARDWLEKHIYAPTGWVPALDDQGRISPVSQVPPADTTGLTVIDNSMAEPSPDWDAGQRVINVIRFTYFRDYSVGPPDPPLAFFGHARQNVLQEQEEVVEFEDSVSIERNGLQELELDGSAFRALGLEITTFEDPFPAPPSGVNQTRASHRPRPIRVHTPTTSEPIVIARVVHPVSGDIVNEVGWQLAQLRQTHVQNRYSFGAPTIRLKVRRSLTQALRAGSWVLLNLSWLPDYVTGRRGLVALAQVIALGDLDCAWRQLTLEVSIEQES